MDTLSEVVQEQFIIALVEEQMDLIIFDTITEGQPHSW